MVERPFRGHFVRQFMENIIDDLNYRGLIEQYSDEKEVRDLLSTKQTIYCGFDPSAASMHLGNFVMISLLMRFQKAGQIGRAHV